MVVSLETGLPRFPPRYSEGVRSISPDSRYAIIHLGNFKLMNLATGESHAAFDVDHGIFFEDSRLLTMQRASRRLTVLNLEDLKEQSLGKVPLHPIRPESQDPNIMGWEDDRVYVCYSLNPGGQERKRSSEVWSFDTRGESLSDPRLEPELTGRWVTWRNGHRGVLRGRNRWAATFYRQFLNLLEAIKIRVKSVQTLVSWQSLDPENGGPRGAMIEDLDFGFRVSPDGRWLVDAHDQQLRCWQLPAQRGLRRWLETLLASLFPGGLVYLIGRLKRSNLSGSQAVAGRFPFNRVPPLG